MGNSKQIGRPLSYSIKDLWAGKVSDRVLKKMKAAQREIKEKQDEQLEARGSLPKE